MRKSGGLPFRLGVYLSMTSDNLPENSIELYTPNGEPPLTHGTEQQGSEETRVPRRFTKLLRWTGIRTNRVESDPISEDREDAVNPVELIITWFERVWNNKDVTAIEELLANPCVLTGLDHREICSPRDFLFFYQKMHSLLDPLYVRLDRVLGDQNRFAGVISIVGTHKASGREIDYKSSCFGSVKNGQLFEATCISDLTTLLFQTGILSDFDFEEALRTGGELKLQPE